MNCCRALLEIGESARCAREFNLLSAFPHIPKMKVDVSVMTHIQLLLISDNISRDDSALNTYSVVIESPDSFNQDLSGDLTNPLIQLIHLEGSVKLN